MFLIIYILALAVSSVKGLSMGPVRWCTLSSPELKKCEALSLAMKETVYQLSDTYTTLECVQRPNHEECMVLLDQGQADLVVLDSNEIFIGGRYHSLIPIMKEIYEGGQEQYFSVAVVRRGTLTRVHHLQDLKGTVACFPSVASMAGWVIPISRLIESRAMEVIDCNNHIKSASEFFSAGCSVNILTDKYNPLGDNNQKLCAACGSDHPAKHCSSQDTFAGYQGALDCLIKNGDVAFVKHTTIPGALIKHPDKYKNMTNDFELLCMDGRRAALSDYLRCNWGFVPSHAVMTTSAKSREQRNSLQTFLKRLVTLFGKNTTDPSGFHLFESAPRYGNSYDLLLSDDATHLIEVPSSMQDFQNYLPSSISKHISIIHSCPVSSMTLCVTSIPEYAKCLKMRSALQAQLLKPEMNCLKMESQYDCMGAIYRREADVAVYEAGDVYTAGLNFELIPIMAERYNLETTHYYVVAVSKEDDAETDVLYLRGRNTCHPAVMHGGGWIIPMAYLLNNDLIRSYDCNSVRAASEYFSKSCAPGALSRQYRHGMKRLNLCHLCHGSGASYCARDHSEPYYGYTGAFQCLVEGGGDIAFLKHTTVTENTDGKRKDWWARNQLTADYQLLCRDGTRKPVTDYESCNLGLIRSNAVVTRGGHLYNKKEIDAYINLLLYAQQFFGRDSDDEWNFQLFHSEEPYADLIFQDATQQLVVLPPSEHHYHPYLGREFLNARYRVDCAASASSARLSLLALAILIAASVFKVKVVLL